MKPTKKPLLDKMNKDDINILAPMLIKLFKAKSSKDNVLQTKKITTFFSNKKIEIGFSGTFTSQRLQKIVNYIRVNSLAPVISSSHGYYYSNDRQDIMEMIVQFEGRIQAMKAAMEGLRYIVTEQQIKDAKKAEECSLGFLWS